MGLIVGTGRHLSAGLPCLRHRNRFNAGKRNTRHRLDNNVSHVAQRHALQNISHVVCNSSTSQAEGWRSGTATSWATEIKRNIVIAVDASEVRLRPNIGP